MNNEKIFFWLKQALLIVITIILLFFITNQATNYYYKMEFLRTPCDLCKKLNPYLEECFNYESIVATDSSGNVIAKGQQALELKNRNVPNIKFSLLSNDTFINLNN